MSSDTFVVIQSITFADKITLGQSAVLGIMSDSFPSLRIQPAYLLSRQRFEPPLGKPVQLARDDLLSLLPRFPIPTKLGSSEVARREMDEVGLGAYQIIWRLNPRLASTSSFGLLLCYVMLPAKILAACSLSVSFLECVREQSPQDS
jgi:hypothetical protein